MAYPTILDWAATLAGLLFCSFIVCAAFVAAWRDTRGPAHRLPFLFLTGLLAFSLAVAAHGFVILRRPYHVGNAWWAQLCAMAVVATAGMLLWHGFGTSLKAFGVRRDGPEDQGGPSGLPSPVPHDPVGVRGAAREIPLHD